MQENEILLSPTEASKLLRIKEETLAVWRCTHRYSLPYIKVGSRVFYRLADIQKFLDSRVMQGKTCNE